ncbi:hypothetical protein OOK44_25015 [Streptomyces cellulosae]|uniref:Uncharacterized protein n=1 Tax=Streptomyces thermodiastaticus TaxID=44061 RepID=A0ABU0KL14_9ACTN|nr:hypothetical protein [Streptomyces sp. McG8]MCP8709196.1 hypothetical protein [Streptomyces sp. AC04842]MCX4479681.1 hypothetical protein [Streptomyces cellulosae]MDQ0489295.1 hypothetical protein [Streptomyces thermodiastaticus]MDX3418368.1 hypothetical protein [Streptomyces sp. MD20-1-1]MXQ61550.1 hypothetical protein [Streptomyces sp. XHT-2]MYQ29825.1 hypothetical protein [Streptomyces sp. SID4956]THC55701.1 hypothetical protein E7X38_18080 [Streptomyces sp. Akac8]UVT12106.1 hypotheti
MSFDEMWGQARSNALARQRSSMQLNQLPAEGGTTQPHLHVDASVLEERSKNAETVRKNFMDADNKALSATSGISLKGFKSDSGVAVFQKRWRTQMRYLESLLEQGVKGNLQASAAEFKAEEAERLSDVKRAGNGRDKN